MNTIEVDSEDRDLLLLRPWKAIQHPGERAQIAATSGRGNIYLKDLIWDRMGHSGPVTVLEGDGYDLRRSNLGPGRGRRGNWRRSPSPNPSPLTDLGVGRHMISTGFYSLCEAEPGEEDDRSHVCVRPLGMARRTAEGWIARRDSSRPWSAPVPRFYDAALLLVVTAIDMRVRLVEGLLA